MPDFLDSVKGQEGSLFWPLTGSELPQTGMCSVYLEKGVFTGELFARILLLTE